MRECTRHPAQSQPGGGVCASCLRERLTSLWRGESFRPAANPAPSQLPESPGANGVATSIIVERTAFHARRRRSLEQELDLSKAESRSLVVMGPVERSSQLSILMSAQKLRTRSMPLDNRSAEDTASRVIREEADELYMDDLDFLEGVQERVGDGVSLPQEGARCFSHTRKSPKWVRVLISPMTTSRNKVFPSRSKEDVRKSRGSRKRLTRFASSDWSHTDAKGDWMDALRSKEGVQPRTTIRSSVLSWLQDSERTKMKKYEETKQLTPSLSSSALDSGTMDTLLRDLITVGHLHEIAEEIEEEDEVLTLDSLDDVDSFGKFLLSAALRHPEAALTRISSAASS